MFDNIQTDQETNSNSQTDGNSSDLARPQNNINSLNSENKQLSPSSIEGVKRNEDLSKNTENDNIDTNITNRPSIYNNQTFFAKNKKTEGEVEDIFDEIDNPQDKEADYKNEPPSNTQVPVDFGDNEDKSEEIDMLEKKKNGKAKVILVILVIFVVAIAMAWLAYTYFISSNDNVVNQNNNVNGLPISTNVNNNSSKVNVNTNTELKITNPSIDTDGDGLVDEDEIKFGTDPKLADTDNDGLSDQEEIIKYKTNPQDNDSDDDGYIDGDEVKNGYNPSGEGRLLDKVELP